MYDIERQQKILEILKSNKTYSVYKLANELYVSGATIRRDLAKMEEKGLVIRTFGAVMINPAPTNKETSFELREARNLSEKRSICQRIIPFIKDNSSIFIDSSTTLLHIVPFLQNFHNLTIITNGLFLAHEIINQTSFHLILTGGEIQTNTNSMLGPISYNTITNFHADICLMSCAAIDNDFGISEPTVDAAALKKLMVNNSDLVILAADKTKFNKKSLYATCSLNDMDVLITNKKFTDEEKNFYKDKKIILG